ncbi:MAG: serine--tRNA ligase [Actinomycetia bacterium]|nr:serine--tRNA ligase [Actinomycetes bacterium]
MIDLRLLRQNPEAFRAGYRKKHIEAPVDEVLAVDADRRQLLAEVERLKAARNQASEEVARRKKRGEDASALIAETRQLGEQIAACEARLKPLEERLNRLLLELPNPPHESVPEGEDADDNVVVETVSGVTPQGFRPRPHWEIGEALDILDFERARKLSGARFSVLKGFGAALSRALVNLMLEEARRRGYEEIAPPYLVLPEAMVGTGQFPKFVEDAFHVVPHDLYLIPTAEVPVTNLHRDEILQASDLPRYYCAYSACFRAEAGAAGRDTRGLIRQHQFDKVELVKLVRMENGLDELEGLRRDAAHILDLLQLPYRVVLLCGGDMGFSQAKMYDLEVWMPSYERYVEISSVSFFGDFQARRAGIRCRVPGSKTLEYVATLNGSALAVGRTIAAILENYQTADGGVVVPEALRPYLGGLERYPA